MSHLIKPENYHALLDLQQTEIAIKKIKDFFLSSISTELRLRRVTAPLFVLKGLGMNDDLNGVERPVTFPIKDMNEAQAEVVHSLAKWKRVTLAEYNVEPGYGIITDMNAIRADEEMDNLHSLYVDQWDWERVMPSHSRNTEYLKKIVNRIYNAILRTEFFICETYPQLKAFLPEDIHFIHAEELRQRYPDLTQPGKLRAGPVISRVHEILGIAAAFGDKMAKTQHLGLQHKLDKFLFVFRQHLCLPF